ncbi:hypothetical protein EGW08_015203, partial [Elysia chlorotica]
MANGHNSNEITACIHRTESEAVIFQFHPNDTELPNSTSSTQQGIAAYGCSNGLDQIWESLQLDLATEICILALSALVLVCSCSALLVCCRRRSQPALLAHFRSLRVCDLLIAVYGASKLALVHNACRLMLNFFTADSLLQTASLASCLSLVAAHGTLSLQLIQPTRYSKLDERSAKTLAVLLWNVSLVLGFLPLLLYQGAFTLSFFTFYSSAYLLTVGLAQTACLAASIALIVLTPSTIASNPTPRLPVPPASPYLPYQRWIRIETALSLSCTLPFLAYLSLTCPGCALGDRPPSESAILYFIPGLLLRALVGSSLHIY